MLMPSPFVYCWVISIGISRTFSPRISIRARSSQASRRVMVGISFSCMSMIMHWLSSGKIRIDLLLL